MIELDHISKTYQRAQGETVHALKEISFRLPSRKAALVHPIEALRHE